MVQYQFAWSGCSNAHIYESLVGHMQEHGHNWLAQQCHIKVKTLWGSGAVSPTTTAGQGSLQDHAFYAAAGPHSCSLGPWLDPHCVFQHKWPARAFTIVWQQ